MNFAEILKNKYCYSDKVRFLTSKSYFYEIMDADIEKQYKADYNLIVRAFNCGAGTGLLKLVQSGKKPTQEETNHFREKLRIKSGLTASQAEQAAYYLFHMVGWDLTAASKKKKPWYIVVLIIVIVMFIGNYMGNSFGGTISSSTASEKSSLSSNQLLEAYENYLKKSANASAYYSLIDINKDGFDELVIAPDAFDPYFQGQCSVITKALVTDHSFEPNTFISKYTPIAYDSRNHALVSTTGGTDGYFEIHFINVDSNGYVVSSVYTREMIYENWPAEDYRYTRSDSNGTVTITEEEYNEKRNYIDGLSAVEFEKFFGEIK